MLSLPTAVKIALLSSYTIDLLRDTLIREGERYGYDFNVYVGPHNQYQNEIIAPDSGLCRFKPDMVFLIVDGEDIKNSHGDLEVHDYLRLVKMLAEKMPTVAIFVSNFIPPVMNGGSLLEYNVPGRLSEQVDRANLLLAETAQENYNIYIIDMKKLYIEHGLRKMFDSRLWYMARMRLGGEGLKIVAGFLLQYIRGARGEVRKCLVVDLDNTLWGGILGEEGAEGIEISRSGGKGRVFYDFQQYIKGLQTRGTLLAICSKNDEGLVREVLRTHPEMLLREDDFVAIVANWQPKSHNIRQIAETLNIGMDAVVFMDDSPFERDEVRNALPMVMVPEVSDDPMNYIEDLENCACFPILNIREEDKLKTQMYHSEMQRRALKSSASSYEQYLESLGLVMNVKLCDGVSAGRVAQLTQKTNQFNLTGRRYTEPEIREIMDLEGWYVFFVSVTDKFGDAGIVGAAIVRDSGREWAIDVFLLSCRVLGRTIENAFMEVILECALKAGKSRVNGWYHPTAKNIMAQDFYSHMGFEKGAKEGEWFALLDSNRHPKYTTGYIETVVQVCGIIDQRKAIDESAMT